MKVEWISTKNKTFQLKDLSPGDTFVFIGEKHLYVKTDTTGAEGQGVVYLEYGNFCYINESKYVTPIEGSFAASEIP